MSYGRYVTIGPSLTPTVKYLVIACVITFLAQIPAPRAMVQFFGLTPYLVVSQLFVWQPFTYLFLHAGFFHLLFNMFGLWMFGSELERYWGSRKFLGFFFFTGAGAGLLSILAHPFSPIPTIGASGAIYGILMAYGMMFPDRLVYVSFLIPVKVKYFVALLGAIAFLSALSSSGTAIDHFAHLGGMVFAFLYMKGWTTPGRIQESYYKWRLRRMERRFRVLDGGRDDKPRPPYTDPRSRRKEDDYWIN
ncbi:MAG TPA: rhomboid family intramembrane serine protease [Acidobacteriota bacterium]|nr:rhomboid family intramembrane serine protease [Acidobacteriota bacterium]